MTQTQVPPAAVLTDTWMISSDSHIVEPPDLWEGRMPAELADRGPRVVSEDDGDWWYIDGKKTMSFLGIQTGDRFLKDADELRTSAAFDEVRSAAYDPAQYIAENETDGVWGSVIYPSQGLVIFGIPASDVVTASMRAYNDWIAEFCSEDMTRLKGVAMVNVDDPDAGARELARCRDLGLCGALITVAPPPWIPFRDPAFDRFWATASDLDMPVGFHVVVRDETEFRSRIKNRGAGGALFGFAFLAISVMAAFTEMLASGVFEQHPRLRCTVLESGATWIAAWLDRMDHKWEVMRSISPAKLKPSEYFYRQCVVSADPDETVIAPIIEAVGADYFVWASDYPHIDASFGVVGEIRSRIASLPEGDQAKVLGGNAIRFYDLPGSTE
jgi:predicted TIM-barrel fold metal-dependent hydrolase